MPDRDESVTRARIVKPFRLIDAQPNYPDSNEAIGRAIAALADGAVDQLHATGVVEALIREHRRSDN